MVSPKSDGPHAAFITESLVPASKRGPLDGWTVAVKDNIDVGGLPTTGGTRYLADHVAASDADVVARLRSSGATIVGKTQLHELGHGVTGVNPTFGTTLHPETPERTVGGSSGGSALAVRGGQARVALGTDTGGSVRIPASFVGLTGFRPSSGRYSSAGVLRISRTRDTVGAIARNVADLVAVDEVLRLDPSKVAAPRIERIGLISEARTGSAIVGAHNLAEAAQVMRRTGVQVLEIGISRDLDRYFDLGITVLMAETVPMIQEYLDGVSPDATVARLVEMSESPDVREILERAIREPIAAEQYTAALEELAEMDDRYRSAVRDLGIDVIAYPTVDGEPPFAARSSARGASELRRLVRLATPATLAGTPAVSIPAGRSGKSHLPVGITLEHLGRSDDQLLELALRVESALKGAM